MNRYVMTLVFPLFIFGCVSQQSHLDRLTVAEKNILQTYSTYDMAEKAARICLNRELTKQEVLNCTSDIMRREVKENSIIFYYAPSQFWTIEFGENGKAIMADLTGKKITRE
ncbi:MAG: hypothetical protein JXR23_10215 [Pontiellaceae bacterium]|nr:hypothetical protein [Pontiellaceae bacterium]